MLLVKTRLFGCVVQHVGEGLLILFVRNCQVAVSRQVDAIHFLENGFPLSWTQVVVNGHNSDSSLLHELHVRLRHIGR